MAVSRSGRYLLLVLVALAAIMSTGTAGAQQASRRDPQADATAIKAEAAVADLRARRLRAFVGHLCATHQNRRCRVSRGRLARAEARDARLHEMLTRTPSHGSGAKSSPGSAGPDTSAGSSSPTSSGSGPTSPTSESPLSQLPATILPVPTSSAPDFQPGLNAGTDMVNDLQGSEILGAKLVRVEWPIATPTAEMSSVIAGYAAKGIRVLPQSSFYGRLPTPAEAQNLANWVKTFGPGGTFWAGRSDGQLAIQSIEFGNETDDGYQYGDEAGDESYATRAQNYALRFKEAAETIAATGIHVGLLAQAEDSTGNWVTGMFTAVPDLNRYVAGWTVHPYGNEWRSALQDLIDQTGAHGAPATIPIDITEWGLTTDNGRCVTYNDGLNKCMNYQEAAEILGSTFGEIREMLGARLGDFILYQVRDQADTGQSTNWQMYFGALQHELQSKGAYTTEVQSLLSS